MQLQTVKTTVEIDPNLLYMAKMKALKENKSLKEIINDSLKKELGVVKTKIKQTKPVQIGGYNLGGIKGSLRRVDIYENF